MLEVVFTDSAAGSLRAAKGWRAGHRFRETVVAVYHVAEAGGEVLPPPSPQTVERVWQGTELPGTAAEVAPLALALDLGDLSDMDTVEKAGRRSLLAGLYGPIPPRCTPQEFDDIKMKAWQKNLETLSRLETARQTGEEVRIWIADWDPGDLCGLYYVCDLLRDAELPVSLVRVPREKVRSDGTMTTYWGLGEVLPEELGELAVGAVPLADVQRRAYANRWRELVSENAPLRAVVNGQLMSVEEDHYDFALRAALPEGTNPVRAASLIGGALSRLPCVGDSWLYRRILAMLAAGELREVTPADPDRPYSAMIARV